MTVEDDLDPAPEAITDLAESCVRFVQAAVGIELDYTQDTLALLDHYLGTAADTEDEVLGLVVPAAGAYFGEVIRRHLGTGHWMVKGTQYEEWRLLVHPGPLSVNPIGVVFECASGMGAGGWGAELVVPESQRDALNTAVAAMGEVRDDDYYTLTIRLEVIELVHTRLKGRSSRS